MSISWIHDGVRDPALRGAYSAVRGVADWSPWVPMEMAMTGAPKEPGVYLLREALTGIVRHVGMAGNRAGSGRPQGLRGRLSAYRGGKGAVSGFGEAALDRALADEQWVESQLEHLRRRGPQRTRDWVRDAVARLDLEVSLATCADREDAAYLERQVLALLGTTGLWTR